MSSQTKQSVKFEPFIADSLIIPEFTIKSILLGGLFGSSGL